MKSRKNVNIALSSKTFTSSTTAAAVTVNKFGQTTFTSVRRQDNENGKFFPLKKSKLDEFDVCQLKNEQPPKIDAKPKVYKFFKSRASTVDVKSNNTADRLPNRVSPKPLVLNNFKQDGVKR